MHQTQQLIDIVNPSPPHPPPIYLALLSSLAKAILLQAETEVTAEKRSAIPLAHVTANLLQALEIFPDVFWAKMCQRAGGWPAPYAIPAQGPDGKPMHPAARKKLLGFRADESYSDYGIRVTGILRVYFHIMSAPVSQPLDPRYRMPRFWTWFSRMMSEPQLLGSGVGAEIIYGKPRLLWNAGAFVDPCTSCVGRQWTRCDGNMGRAVAQTPRSVV